MTMDLNTIKAETERDLYKGLYEQLLQLGESVERIVTSTLGFLEIQCGWQYFDFFEPGEKEIFLDAGTYDGGTIVDF